MLGHGGEKIIVTFTPQIRNANFVLGVPADGTPTTIDRFYAVREWVEKNG